MWCDGLSDFMSFFCECLRLRRRRYPQKLGQQHGCHSCGATRAWTWRTFFKRGPGGGQRGVYQTFHADHQPPVKYAAPGQLQRFFPQCPSCSTLQSAACRTDIRTLVVHTVLRRWHGWISWPLVFLTLRPTLDRLEAATHSPQWAQLATSYTDAIVARVQDWTRNVGR